MPNPNVNPDATVNATPISTQDAPVGSQLQDPTSLSAADRAWLPSSQPAAQPPTRIVSDQGTAPVTASSPNVRTHSFIARAASALLDAVSGTPPKSYSVDASGKMTALPLAPENTTDKLKRVLNTFGTGLEAGSQVGPQKSKLAAALAGAGAGFGAQSAQETAEDRAKKEQASQDFERDQQMILRKHDIARINAATVTNYIANRKAMNEMDPHYQEGQAFLRMVQASPELAPHIQEVNDKQLEALATTDKDFAATHIVKPLGWQPSVDPASGKPLQDSDGSLIEHMTFAVLDGTKDGKLVVSPQWAADFAKYGKMAGVPNADTVRASDEYDLKELLPFRAKVEEQKKLVTEGELNREYAWAPGPNGKQVPVSINTKLSIGDPDRIKQMDYTPGKLLDEKATYDFKEAQAANQREQAKNASLFGPASGADPLAVANYKHPDNLMGQSTTDLRKYLTDNKQPVPPNFETLYAVGHYDEDPKTFAQNLRKGSPQMSRDMAISYIRRYINPNYQDTNYDAVKKMKVEFADVKSGPGASLLAFNTATGHLGQLWVAAEALHNKDTQALNKIANAYNVQVGKSPVTTFNSIKAAIVGEIGKTFKGGPADIPERQDIEKELNTDMGPTQLSHAIFADAHLMLTKAKENAWAYHVYTGEWPPALISPSARAVYKDLGIDTSDVESGSQVRGTSSSQTVQPNLPSGVPQGASHVGKDANGNVVGYVLNGKWVSVGGNQ